jgi:hypothetical protein
MVALVCAIAFVACGQPPGQSAQAASIAPSPDSPAQEPGGAFEAIDSPAMEYLPRVEEVPGWRLSGDPLVYPGEQLRTYIGRQAEQYLEYELQDATIGQYEQIEGSGLATVEIYRFPDFVKAFGAFSSRKSSARKPLELANEAFLGSHSAHVWRGPFYVRVVGSEIPEEGLVGITRAVVDRMPPAPGIPAVFQFLPSETRVGRSERYSAGAVFGQPYLAGGFTADYRVNDRPIEGAIIPAPSKEVASQILDRYRAFFVNNGRLLDRIPNLGEDNLTAEDRYMGRTIAFRLDRFVVVFRSFGPLQDLMPLAIGTDQRILNSIRVQLQAADRAERAQGMTTGTSQPRRQSEPASAPSPAPPVRETPAPQPEPVSPPETPSPADDEPVTSPGTPPPAPQEPPT